MKIAAEFAELADLVAAIRVARRRGATQLEAFTPYAAAEVDEALGARRSWIAIAAGAGGLAGAIGGYALQWLLDVRLYPVLAGGRPPHMPLAFVIITVEMGFLIGGVAVFFACLFASRLFRLWDPMFDVPGFESATRAGYWLTFSGDSTMLRDTPAVRIETVGEAA